MKLPNAERAVVAREKISGYLLSFTSDRGQHKARYFAQCGFSADDWEVMADALLQLSLSTEVTEVEETRYGVQYVIIGNIESPDGYNPRVKSVWQIDYGAENPRLITAIPW